MRSDLYWWIRDLVAEILELSFYVACVAGFAIGFYVLVHL